MGSGVTRPQPSNPGTAVWSITVKVYKTVTYHLKSGDSTILKQTGPSANPINYGVNVKTGEMSLMRDGVEIPAGHDGDLNALVDILRGMVNEIGKHVNNDGEEITQDNE